MKLTKPNQTLEQIRTVKFDAGKETIFVTVYISNSLHLHFIVLAVHIHWIKIHGSQQLPCWTHEQSGV